MGTRLAMRDMDTIEEGEANGWSAKETAAVWYDTNDDGQVDEKDEPSSFTFDRLRVGLAGTDKLLVVAEGTLMGLEATPQMQATYDQNGNLNGLVPAEDDDGNPVYTFQPKKADDGAYETEKGVYALSFGMGEQGLGAASLYLSNYDLTPGSAMNASVSFMNSGDVAIRASEENPAIITLFAGSTKVAEWKLTDNVRAGPQVRTQITPITMPVDLAVGDKIYFNVNEDVA